uniref:RxLR effector candidate protein n=1 Tax=Hyaloperonospora arabidopsidis (strain Emoy2) TaxID=559515 RepID=M4BH62_HYAAE
MRGAIASLQSPYQHHGCVFSDGPFETSDVSRRIGGRDPQRQSSAGREAPAVVRRRIAAPANKIARSLTFSIISWAQGPSCRATADSRASEQDSSFNDPSRHGGSRYAPRESVDHRANPPMALVGAGIPTPNHLKLQAEVGRFQQPVHVQCDRFEQERQDRLSLEA